MIFKLLLIKTGKITEMILEFMVFLTRGLIKASKAVLAYDEIQNEIWKEYSGVCNDFSMTKSNWNRAFFVWSEIFQARKALFIVYNYAIKDFTILVCCGYVGSCSFAGEQGRSLKTIIWEISALRKGLQERLKKREYNGWIDREQFQW